MGKNCEIYNQGKISEFHIKGKRIILCDIKDQKECPYDNAGEPIFYTEFNSGIAHVCKSEGLTKIIKKDNSQKTL